MSENQETAMRAEAIAEAIDRLESRVLSLESDFAAHFRKWFVVDLGLCVIASSVLIFVWKAVYK